MKLIKALKYVEAFLFILKSIGRYPPPKRLER